MASIEGRNGDVLYVCEKCGKKNRLPMAALHTQGKCGGCKAAIEPPTKPIAVDSKTFDKLTKFAKTPLLIDFWASWCGPCLRAAPELEKLAAARSGSALVLKVDTEANPDLAARFNIRGIPHFMIFSGGKPVDQRSGLMSAGQMASWLDQAVR